MLGIGLKGLFIKHLLFEGHLVEEQLLSFVAGIDCHAPQWTFIECLLHPLLQPRNVLVHVPRLEVKSWEVVVFHLFGPYDMNQCLCPLQRWYLLREISIKAVSSQHHLKILASWRVSELQRLEMCSHETLRCKSLSWSLDAFHNVGISPPTVQRLV